MALNYIGNCAWERAGEPEPKDPPGDIPTTNEPWIGRSDQLATFLADWPVGKIYLGGYITGRNVKDLSPGPGLASVDLVVSRAPDFTASQSPSTLSIRTAVKSKSYDDSSLYTEIEHFFIRREVTYKAPTTRYRYFSSSQPSGPRFSTSSGSIIRIKDYVTVDRYKADWVWFDRMEGPASIINATLISQVNLVISTDSQCDADPEPGTPWWRCTDTATSIYNSDDDA